MIAAAIVLAVALLQGGVPDTLTLDEALARAIRLRGDARVAAAIVAEARAQQGIAGAITNPVGNYAYTGDTPRQHATVAQSFDWLLVRNPNRAAAEAGIVRAAADSILTIADIVAGVRLAFFDAIAANEAHQLALGSQRIADSLRFIADRRFAGGDISQFEDDQVALEAARVQQFVSRAREARTVALAALARAIAWQESGPMPSPLGTLDLDLEDEPRSPTSTDGLPLVRAAIADSTLAEYRQKSASRARIPMPAIEAGMAWDDPEQPGRNFLMLGIAIPLPLSNRNGALMLARAQAQQAGGRATEARLEGGRQLAEAIARRDEAAIRARTARDSLLPAAIRLRERATTAFRAGETGVVPVLDALRAEREVAASVILELLNFQDAITQYNRLLGGTQ